MTTTPRIQLNYTTTRRNSAIVRLAPYITAAAAVAVGVGTLFLGFIGILLAAPGAVGLGIFVALTAKRMQLMQALLAATLASTSLVTVNYVLFESRRLSGVNWSDQFWLFAATTLFFGTVSVASAILTQCIVCARSGGHRMPAHD